MHCRHQHREHQQTDKNMLLWLPVNRINAKSNTDMIYHN